MQHEKPQMRKIVLFELKGIAEDVYVHLSSDSLIESVHDVWSVVIRRDE